MTLSESFIESTRDYPDEAMTDALHRLENQPGVRKFLLPDATVILWFTGDDSLLVEDDGAVSPLTMPQALDLIFP
jgi:hypothetical protein